jgi:glutaminyl-tRNA synthetase
VRLRYAYIITCTGFDKDASGNITAVRCTYDPETKGGNAPDNRKVKGTIHWVSAQASVPIEARIYDYLFKTERPMEIAPRPDGSPGDFTDNINQDSLEVISNAWGEKALANVKPGDAFQFERLGYFACDPDTQAAEGGDVLSNSLSSPTEGRHTQAGKPVFNKTIGLRDTWAKIANKG